MRGSSVAWSPDLSGYRDEGFARAAIAAALRCLISSALQALRVAALRSRGLQVSGKAETMLGAVAFTERGAEQMQKLQT